MLPERAHNLSSRAVDVAVMLLATGLFVADKIWYWLHTCPALGTDFPRYLFIAHSLLRQDWPHAIHYHYPPLYPLLLAPFTAIISSGENAGRAAGIAIGALTVVPIYFLAKKLFNRQVAVAAIVLFAFKFSRVPLLAEAEPLLNLLVYTAAALGLCLFNGLSFFYVAVTALVLGLATLAKMEGQAFFMLWFGFLCLRLYRFQPRGRALALAAACWFFYLLPQLPYLAKYYSDTHHLTINPKLATLFYLHNEPDWSRASYSLRSDGKESYTVFQQTIAEGDRGRARVHFLAYVWNHAGPLARVYADRSLFTFREILPAMLWELIPGWPLAAGAFLLIGWIGRGRSPTPRLRALYLLGFCLLPVFLVPLFIPQYRFFSSMIPALAIFLARGLERLSAWPAEAGAGRQWGGKAAKAQAPLLAALVALCLLPDLLVLQQLPPSSDYCRLREDRIPPAEYLREHLPPGRKIMSNWQVIPFWYLAGIVPERDLAIPIAPLPDLIAYARQEKVEFIVLEKSELADRYPALEPLTAIAFRHPDLERVYLQYSPNHRLYFIYRIRPPRE